jgi:small-conductance mechanosensitive channel
MLYAPLDPARLQEALASPRGWADLALVGLCIGIAWAFDRRLAARARARAHTPGARHHLQAGVGRVVFSLVALLLLALDRVVFKYFWGVPVFVDIAIPMLVALAVIRVLVYGMRQVFAQQAWLKASERAVAFTIWGLVVLYFIGVLPEIAREFDAIVLPLGKTSISLLTVAKSIAAVVATLIVTLWLSSVLEARLLTATSFDSNIKAVLAKIVKAVLLVVGVLVALQAIGFDLTLLTVFSGALGVGIGLGLQKLAANYIAGFTILLDKSIRLDDMITVDNRHGVVARVTARYVVVRSLDGVEAIVPNETLVTTTVLNHSSSAREARGAVTIQIAYDADLDTALRLMEEAARAEPRVMSAPNPPQAIVTGFMDNGIGLELGFWIRDPEMGQGALKSAINRRMFAAFREHGIEIPYPRRDVRWVGGSEPPAPPPRAL